MGEIRIPPPMDLSQLQGPLEIDEVRKRHEFELDMVLGTQIQRLLVEAGDLLISCKTNESFNEIPDREKLLKDAEQIYSILAKKRLRMLRSLNKMLGRMGPFRGKEDSVFDEPTKGI